MELSVRKTDLLRELQLFQGIIERKNTIPILANVLIEAKEGSDVHLVATDLEVTLRSTCPASIVKAGTVTIPAKKLYEIVRALPETEIRIQEKEKGVVKVAAEKFESRIQTLPREDFPSLPAGGDGESVLLPRDVLGEMVTRTQFAITSEDTRYFLNGALFLLQANTIKLVATDGHRLALVSTKSDGIKRGKNQEELKAILPKKTLWELSRLLAEDIKKGSGGTKKGKETVQFQCGDNHLFFDLDGRQLVSRVIEAQFPSYERVIPKENDKAVEFERDRLTNAIKRVALLSSERSRAVKFHITENKIDIISNSPEVGEATETLAVDYTGDPLDICFNAQYILDFLSVVDTESVKLEFKDEMSQAIMRPADDSGCDYTYVIMPMRV
jgi:DNA polymerase-3 subunit beta